MIKKIIAVGLLVLFINSTNSFAQSKAEAAVATAVETLRKGMLDADKAVLDKYTAPELSYGHSSGKVETKQEFVESLSSGKSDFLAIYLSNQTIKVEGNTAIVRHVLSGSTNDNGTPGTVKLSVLTIWQKQGGQWKLLARQAVRMTQ